MLRPFLTRPSIAVMLICMAMSQPTGPRSAKLVDCPDAPGDGVLPPEPETNTANLRAGFVTFGDLPTRLVVYEDRKGLAVFQGDIILGTTASMQQSLPAKPGQIATQGIVLSGPIQWPSATVPYDIDPNLPNQARVAHAIAEWTTKTSIQFILHSTEPDYVYFTVGTGCDSALGHQGGQQLIHLAAGCAVPQVIHEIGHTVGLLHEHNRSDRDQYIQINLSNIPPGWQAQFQNTTSSQDVGVYDFCSIMHYPAIADGYGNGRQPVFQETNSCPACVPGKATQLSTGDVSAVNLIYPAAVRLKSSAPRKSN